MSNEHSQVPAKAAFFDELFEGELEFHSPKQKAEAVDKINTFFKNNAQDKSLLVTMFPHYHRDTTELASMDIYMVMHLFGVTDDSGSLHHALKKLMVNGERGGNKPASQDTQEAILSLIRYMEIHYPAEASNLMREIACHFAKSQGWKTASGNPIGTKL